MRRPPSQNALKPVAPRFWARIRKTRGCWIWTGAKITAGYGTLNVNGKTAYAHRLSWSIHHGRIPGKLFVLHRCDNPACVRPSHLFLGTAKDNAVDMVKKGRNKHGNTEGELNGCAKLTAAEVNDIRAAYGPVTLQYLADKYGVTKSAVWDIVKYRSWANA